MKCPKCSDTEGYFRMIKLVLVECLSCRYIGHYTKFFKQEKQEDKQCSQQKKKEA